MDINYPLLDRKALAVIHTAAKKKSRYPLDGVLIDDTGLTATDGKMLSHVTHGGPALAGVEPFVLGIDDAKELNRAIGAGKKERPFEFQFDTKTATRSGESRAFTELPGNFPPWRDVLPKNRIADNDIGVSAARLSCVLKAAVAFGGKDVKLRMSVVDGKSPIIFAARDADGREFTGLLMPEPL